MTHRSLRFAGRFAGLVLLLAAGPLAGCELVVGLDARRTPGIDASPGASPFPAPTVPGIPAVDAAGGDGSGVGSDADAGDAVSSDVVDASEDAVRISADAADE